MSVGARILSFEWLVAFAACVAVGLPARAAEAPLIRVGLASAASELRVSVDKGTLSLAEGKADWRPASGPLRFVTRAGEPPPARRSRYFVDVREEADDERALRVAEALRPTVEAPLSVHSRGSRHLVVAGPFEDARPARELLSLLSAAGMTDAALREEVEESTVRSRLLRVDEAWTVSEVEDERVRLRARGGLLLVDGKPYRGELHLSLDGRGRLRVVNALSLEDYLRGVVPEELGPTSFPELEALASQAVAARTWVLTQIGRHGSEDFDVCPTAHCQVYGGAGSEHELTDRAVEETSGRVLAWKGEPATAFFSSTCGGRTEAVENVFDHAPVPYLAGVSCYPESVAFTSLRGRLIEADWLRADGGSAHDILARLWALGVVDDGELASRAFSKRARDDEAARWLRRAARSTGLELGEEAAAGLRTATAIDFLRTLSSALGWDRRRGLVAAADLAAASRFSELEGLEGEALETALLAAKGGLLPPGLTRGWAAGKLVRGNVLEVLDLWLTSRGAYEAPALRFFGGDGAGLRVLDGSQRRLVGLVPEPALLSGRKGRRPSSRSRLELKLSDKLRLLGPPGEPARALVLEEDPDGAAFDRTSSYSWWERRIPFEEVSRQAKQRAGVNGLADLSIRRVSPAGRVIGVELVDAGGLESLVEGFAARGLLGLPDSRAHVEIERGSDGRPVAVRATGRGWGHGVGLCQFGAFGMALAGRTREEILAHYYPGAALVDLSAVSLPARPR